MPTQSFQLGQKAKKGVNHSKKSHGSHKKSQKSHGKVKKSHVKSQCQKISSQWAQDVHRTSHGRLLVPVYFRRPEDVKMGPDLDFILRDVLRTSLAL